VDPSALRIYDVEIKRNPTNVLSCHVRWKTNVPAASTVQFWDRQDFHWQISHSSLVKEHSVLVIGMHASTTYSIRALSRRDPGEEARSTVSSFTTEKLPSYLPKGEVKVFNKREVYGGWTLMTLSAGLRSGGFVFLDPGFVPTAVMYDMEGEPVWYYTHGLPRLGDTRFVDNHVLSQSMGSIHEPKLSAIEVDLAGKVVWEGPPQPLNTVHDHYNHHFEKLPNGNYLALKNVLIRKVVGDVLHELTPGHKIVWSWNTFNYLTPDLSKWSGTGFFDYAHGNSAQMDLKNNVVYYNARHLDTVVKIDKTTGKLLWKLGKKGDFAQDPTANFPWFEQAHAVELLDSGNIILYDNGLSSRKFSRAVEYELDEKKMTAKIAWQYSGFPNETWQTLYWGDADRLPNGNTLITAGTWATGQRSAIFEVTKDFRKVWEIQLPIRKDSNMSVGAYNSQRLIPPLVKKIAGPPQQL